MPEAGLDQLVCPAPTMAALKAVVNFHKARSILRGHWGFHKDKEQQRATVVLLRGPAGTGKKMAASCLGYELGRPVVNIVALELTVPQLLTHQSKLLQSTLTDAATSEAVVVVQDSQALASAADNAERGRASLRAQLGRFPGLVLLLANVDRDFASAGLSDGLAVAFEVCSGT